MLLHYLGKLKNQKFALCMHVKHVLSVTFYHLSNRYLPNVMKISAKINTMQNINILLFVVFVRLLFLTNWRNALLWYGPISDRTYIDTAIDQCIKRLQACVRTNGGHLTTFCEQTLANNLHFYVFLVQVASVHRLRFLLCWCLMVDRPTLLNCKALSLLRTVKEQKVKCCYYGRPM